MEINNKKEVIILSIENISNEQMEKIMYIFRKAELPYNFIFTNKKINIISKTELIELLEKLKSE